LPGVAFPRCSRSLRGSAWLVLLPALVCNLGGGCARPPGILHVSPARRPPRWRAPGYRCPTEPAASVPPSAPASDRPEGRQPGPPQVPPGLLPSLLEQTAGEQGDGPRGVSIGWCPSARGEQERSRYSVGLLLVARPGRPAREIPAASVSGLLWQPAF